MCIPGVDCPSFWAQWLWAPLFGRLAQHHCCWRPAHGCLRSGRQSAARAAELLSHGTGQPRGSRGEASCCCMTGLPVPTFHPHVPHLERRPQAARRRNGKGSRGRGPAVGSPSPFLGSLSSGDWALPSSGGPGGRCLAAVHWLGDLRQAPDPLSHTHNGAPGGRAVDKPLTRPLNDSQRG